MATPQSTSLYDADFSGNVWEKKITALLKPVKGREGKESCAKADKLHAQNAFQMM